MDGSHTPNATNGAYSEAEAFARVGRKMDSGTAIRCRHVIMCIHSSDSLDEAKYLASIQSTALTARPDLQGCVTRDYMLTTFGKILQATSLNDIHSIAKTHFRDAGIVAVRKVSATITDGNITEIAFA